ncbi:MAG: immunity 40 family protein [Helicobacteraceae bacterium]|jgi:hypothetical protein|nr:immunity 40 family protein [Helicobacteraceae bacterium]
MKGAFKPFCLELPPFTREESKEISVERGIVIKTIVKNAMEILLYRGVNPSLIAKNGDILIPYKGKFKFDTSKEFVKGREELWGATAYERGSIVAVLKPSDIDFAEVFKSADRPVFLENPSLGNTPSAHRKAKNEAESGNIAIVFPAESGDREIEIYAQGETMEYILETAEKQCRNPYYTSENCDFENRSPFFAALKEKKDIIWSKEADLILSAGVYILANNWLLDRNQALKASGELFNLKIPIIGGEVYTQKPNGAFYKLLDGGWYLKQNESETNEVFLKRGVETALEHIKNCPQNEPYFALIPRKS